MEIATILAKGALYGLLFVFILGLWAITLLVFLDALEWEQTGSCQHCLVIPHIKSSLS